MLETGEIDALIGPRIPSCFTTNPSIARLFTNYKEIERAYYERTRIVPLMHTVVMKRSIYERHPWVAQSLHKAYRESLRRCYAVMRDVNALPYCLPWYLPALEETLEVFGDDFWPEGIEANWPALSLLMQYSREQGLIDRIYSPDELFAPSTLTEFRI
jgi:4,5-dihydroxyphthalate decarboxylase